MELSWRNTFQLFFGLVVFVESGFPTKTVLLSQGNSSVDNINCGSILQPCATFLYALSKLSDGGGILRIDGGVPGRENRPYIVNISRPTVIIHGSLTITKNFEIKHSLNPIIIASTQVSFSVYDTVECFGNLTISCVNFNSSESTHNTFWFLSKSSVSRFSRENSTFRIENSTFHRRKALKSYLNNLETVILNSYIIEIQFVEESIFRYRSYCMLRKTVIKTLRLLKGDDFFLMTNSCMSNGLLIFYKEFGMIRIRTSSFLDTNVNIFMQNVVFHDNYFERIHRRIAKVEITAKSENRIESCVFENIPLLLYGGSTKTAIANATFRNLQSNSLLSALTSRLCMSIKIENSKFENNSAKFGIPSSMRISTRTLALSNVNLSGSVHEKIIVSVDVNSYKGQYKFVEKVNTSFNCKDNQYLNSTMISTLNSYFFILYCKDCPFDSYTLDAASYMIKNYEKKQIASKKVKCKKCPFGGVCNGKISSKGGYWGYIVHTTLYDIDVEFIKCPPFYCCATLAQCTSYNTCSKQREGRLCSQCKHGFTTSITSQQKCVSNNACENEIINITAYISSALVYLCCILYLREIVVILKRLLGSPRKRTIRNSSTSNMEINLNERLLPECFEKGGDGSTAVSYQILLNKEIPSAKYTTTSSIFSGTLKIMFFFYQAISIIRVHTSEKLKIPFPTYLDIIGSLFNVRPDIAYSNQNLCFLRNLQNIHIRILKYGYSVVMVFFVLFLLSFRKLHQYFFKKAEKNKTCEVDRIDDRVGWYNRQPFDLRLKCAYLQILIIGFAGVSTFAFQSIHCVNINKQSYLFIQASISCYQPWQILVWLFIFMWVIPFPFLLFFSSNQLYKCLLTPDDFLLAIAFSPFFVYKVLKRCCFKQSINTLTVKDAMVSKHLLIILTEPFKERQNGGRLCWEAILMLRRTVLVVIHTFMSSQILKMFPTVFALLIFIGHHNMIKPYKDEFLNKLENICLFSLISMSFVNMFWGCADEYDLMANEAYRTLSHFLLYYELMVVSLPFIALICGCVVFIWSKVVKLCESFSTKKLELH